jgi:branched-chain amino acid transport system ATP-binding protein
VSKRFGPRRALEGFDLTVRQGEVVGIIGPNGSGKTTLFNLITGQVQPDCGVIRVFGQDAGGWPPHRFCHAGVARTFQIPQPFPEMTALENVLIPVWFGQGDRPAGNSHREAALGHLRTVGLPHKVDTLARDLTLSEQRRLEVARALATRPRLLLLDEIAAGLSPKLVAQVVGLVEQWRGQGLTLLIIDHFLNLTLKAAGRLVALDQGEKLAEGPPAEVFRHPEVVAAYLGTRAARATPEDAPDV